VTLKTSTLGITVPPRLQEPANTWDDYHNGSAEIIASPVGAIPVPLQTLEAILLNFLNRGNSM
jgi:hypothetical protein